MGSSGCAINDASFRISSECPTTIGCVSDDDKRVREAGASSEVDVPLSPADGDLSEFSLDLDAMADEVRIDDASAPEAGDDTSLDTHAPLQVAEAVELDFDAFESFRAGDAGSASTTPESTSEPPLDPPTLELPTLDELAQDHDQPDLVLDMPPTSSGASDDEAVVDHDAPQPTRRARMSTDPEGRPRMPNHAARNSHGIDAT